jgi:hypothetical protein
MDEAVEKSVRERLRALAQFLPVFEEPGFEFGTWHGSYESSPGVLAMPYFERSAAGQRFVSTAYTGGWVLIGFDWPSWQGSAEATALLDDPAALEEASPEQLAKLLTLLVRRDRFVEGGLNSAFEAGLLTAIARRAAALGEEIEG